MILSEEDCKYLEEAIMHGRLMCCVCGRNITNIKTTHIFYTDGSIIVNEDSRSLINKNSSGEQEIYIGADCMKKIKQRKET